MTQQIVNDSCEANFCVDILYKNWAMQATHTTWLLNQMNHLRIGFASANKWQIDATPWSVDIRWDIKNQPKKPND